MTTAMRRLPRVVIFGSTVSRDALEIGDEAFEVLGHTARQSWISAHRGPSCLPRGEVPEGFALHRAKLVERDLVGSGFQDVLDTAAADLVLLDLVDERFGVVELAEREVVTLSPELMALGWLTGTSSSNVVRFGTDRHFELWRAAAEAFVGRLRSHGMLERTLMLRTRFAEEDDLGEALALTGGIPSREWDAMYERYFAFIESLGVRTYDIGERPRSSRSHRWGPAPFHYEESVYDGIRSALPRPAYEVGAPVWLDVASVVPAASGLDAVAASGRFDFRRVDPDGAGHVVRKSSPDSLIVLSPRDADALAALFEQETLKARLSELGGGRRLVLALDATSTGFALEGVDAPWQAVVVSRPAALDDEQFAVAVGEVCDHLRASAGRSGTEEDGWGARLWRARTSVDAVRHASLSEFRRLPRLVDGVHLVRIQELGQLEVLVEGVHDGSGPLPVILNGAITGAYSDGPVFAGRALAASVGTGFVSLSDPIHRLVPRAQLGWHLGHAGRAWVEGVVMTLEHLASATGRPLLFVGGSGGGFASLLYNALVACPASAVVWNPQTNVLKYGPGPVDAYFAAAYPMVHARAERGRSLELLEGFARAIGLPLDVLSPEVTARMRRCLVLQQESDWHLGAHFMPFVQAAAMALAESGVYVGPGDVTGIVRDWPGVHAPPPREVLVRAVTLMMDESRQAYDVAGALQGLEDSVWQGGDR